MFKKNLLKNVVEIKEHLCKTKNKIKVVLQVL